MSFVRSLSGSECVLFSGARCAREHARDWDTVAVAALLNFDYI